MSVARPARSLVGKCLASTRPTAAPSISCQQQFHTSTVKANRRPRFRNIKAEELGLTNPRNLEKFRKETFPEYTKEELEELKSKYTPEQIESLKAGESAVNPDDIILQGRLRDDPYRPTYVEDYTKLDPRYDLKPEVKGQPEEMHWPTLSEFTDEYGEKFSKITSKKTKDQLSRAMLRALKRVNESNGQEMIDLTQEEFAEFEKDPELLERYLEKEDDSKPDANAKGADLITRAQALKLEEAVDAAWKAELDKIAATDDPNEIEPTNVDLLEGTPAGEIRAASAEAAELGKVPGVEGLYNRTADPEDMGRDDDGRYREIKRLTGMKLKDIQSLYCKVLVSRSVSNQTRLGKVRSSSIVAIAGNGNGRLGLGIAKATDPQVAAETARFLAIRNMKPIRRYENRTIYGNVSSKVSGTVVELFTRPPGMFSSAVPIVQYPN